MFHRHTWGSPRFAFTPPVERLSKLTAVAPDLMRELTCGFTTIEQTCSGCGVVRYDRAAGDVTPEGARAVAYYPSQVRRIP